MWKSLQKSARILMRNQKTAASATQIKEEQMYKSTFLNDEILPEISDWLSLFSYQEPMRLKAS